MVFGPFLCRSISYTKYRSNFNDVQPRFTLANHGIKKFLKRENKQEDQDGPISLT